MDKQQKRQIASDYKRKMQQGGVYAIYCTQNGKRLLLSTADMQGSRNRYDFAQITGGCIHPKMRDDWAKYGGAAFIFEVVETLQQQETQTDAEFHKEVAALLEMLAAQADSEALY
jgi:hypothetical protein